TFQTGFERWLPHGAKLTSKALAEIRSNVPAWETISLVGLATLLRLAALAKERGLKFPPDSLEQIARLDFTSPGAVPFDGECMYLPTHATPVTDKTHLLRLRRLIALGHAAYARSDAALLRTMRYHPEQLLERRWESNSEDLIPAHFLAVDHH